MNTELVESLVQVIHTLPQEEQSVLKQRLISPDQAKATLTPAHASILSALIASGQVIAPPQQQQDHVISETEFRTIVAQVNITGQPLSETAIENRGEKLTVI
jgi:hypothetical protein